MEQYQITKTLLYPSKGSEETEEYCWVADCTTLVSCIKKSHTIPVLILPWLKAFIHILFNFILFDGCHQQ